ncbi:4Fe-4S binding protein [Silvimonas sp.]|uniref:4Fe-4S binding protein n=1 Tax=Silvimonas sp. TaxID=2650811 RepID=UPI002840A0EE|nr:4Fe-4S binding protein [Silvimonas sp.]MDR3426043.1 4Fe-4S binding protein [Silvimonas sp.]
MSTLYPSPAETAAAKPKKTLVRRIAPDRSQQVRRAVQFAFLLLNAVIGVQFILWVRYFESLGSSHYFGRPAGVDGWLPIAGLMNLRYFLATRQIPAIHPSAMVLVCVFLLASLVVKKAFCSWLCPVGTVSEYLWKLGRKLFRRNVAVPKWLDVALRSLKYILLAFFLYIVFTMPVQDLGDFLASPFGIVADVKMLNFFRYLGTVGIIVIAAFVVLSVFIQNFWCRFLCPYGALMGIVSALSPVKIRRDAEACIDCGKCNKACPSHLPVDMLVQVRSVECTGCMECIAVCPAENALQMALPPRTAGETRAARWRSRTLKPQMVAVVLAVVFFGLIGAARLTGHWQTNISRDIYMQLVPNAENFDH